MQRGTLIALWALTAVAAAFVDAIVRLSLRATSEIAAADMTAGRWLVLVVLACGMMYVEGYRALQRRFVPVVVARASQAVEKSVWSILAPLYVISLVGVPWRLAVRSAFGLSMIVLCVAVVRQLPSPWRGIIDAAVACALAWGLVALVSSIYALVVGRAQVPEAT